VRARDLLIDFPVIDLDSPVIDAVRLFTEQNLPGLIVVDDEGSLFAILPGTEVLRLVIPDYYQDDPILARVVDEAHADGFLHQMSGRTLRACLPAQTRDLPISGPDATALQLAVLMVRTHSPLVAVMDGDRLVGALTLKTLLERVLAA
jgi:CBS domain-containing protein